jgi:hypothetical protein
MPGSGFRIFKQLFRQARRLGGEEGLSHLLDIHF